MSNSTQTSNAASPPCTCPYTIRGFFPDAPATAALGTGDGDEYVRATINDHGLQVLPKNNIDDILYYKCDGCGTDTVAGDLCIVRRGKGKGGNVCSKCAKGVSG